MGLGLSRTAFLARSVAFSVLHHALPCIAPSHSLQKIWQTVEQSLVSGPRIWLGLAMHCLKALFKMAGGPAKSSGPSSRPRPSPVAFAFSS